jgi:hypothetical protein
MYRECAPEGAQVVNTEKHAGQCKQQFNHCPATTFAYTYNMTLLEQNYYYEGLKAKMHVNGNRYRYDERQAPVSNYFTVVHLTMVQEIKKK